MEEARARLQSRSRSSAAADVSASMQQVLVLVDPVAVVEAEVEGAANGLHAQRLSSQLGLSIITWNASFNGVFEINFTSIM